MSDRVRRQDPDNGAEYTDSRLGRTARSHPARPSRRGRLPGETSPKYPVAKDGGRQRGREQAKAGARAPPQPTAATAAPTQDKE